MKMWQCRRCLDFFDPANLYMTEYPTLEGIEKILVCRECLDEIEEELQDDEARLVNQYAEKYGIDL